jgi:hypothetical protein
MKDCQDLWTKWLKCIQELADATVATMVRAAAAAHVSMSAAAEVTPPPAATTASATGGLQQAATDMSSSLEWVQQAIVKADGKHLSNKKDEAYLLSFPSLCILRQLLGVVVSSFLRMYTQRILRAERLAALSIVRREDALRGERKVGSKVAKRRKAGEGESQVEAGGGDGEGAPEDEDAEQEEAAGREAEDDNVVEVAAVSGMLGPQTVTELAQMGQKRTTNDARRKYLHMQLKRAGVTDQQLKHKRVPWLEAKWVAVQATQHATTSAANAAPVQPATQSGADTLAAQEAEPAHSVAQSGADALAAQEATPEQSVT